MSGIGMSDDAVCSLCTVQGGSEVAVFQIDEIEYHNLYGNQFHFEANNVPDQL